MYSRAASGVQRCLRSIRPRFHDIGRRNENMIANLDWAIVHPFCDDCLMLREWVFEVAFARVIYPVHPPRDRAPATVGTSTPASSTTVTIIRASMTPGSCIFLRADRCVGSHPTFWLVGASHFMYCHNDCLAIARADMPADYMVQHIVGCLARGAQPPACNCCRGRTATGWATAGEV